jgi:hypothetical protein
MKYSRVVGIVVGMVVGTVVGTNVELCILYTEKGACTPDKDGQK